MKKITTFLAFFLALNFVSVAQTTNWDFDKTHTNVQFTVTHMMISEVAGSFKLYDGKVSSTNDDFSGSNVEFTVDVNSINTDNADRDKHLKSDDFFNSEKFPVMKFKSASFKKKEGNTYQLIGNLTIRDVTKVIVLDVEYKGTVKDPWGNTKAGFKIKGRLNRFDYNLKWSKTLETGGAVVDNFVTLEINAELTKQK